MFSRRFLPTAFAFAAFSVQAQQDGPSLNAEAILRDLDQIEIQQKQVLISARQQAINLVKSAAGSGATATDLYENAVEGVQFEGIKNKGGAFADWKSARAEVLRTKEAQAALLLHLRYLALSLERKGSDKPEMFVTPSLAYVNDLANSDALFLKLAQSASQPASSDRDREQQAIDREAIKLKDELLNKALTDSVFVKWLRLGPALPKGEDWELTPGSLSGILDKNVRPVLRAAKNAALLPTYELEMKVLADRVSMTHRDHDASEFNTVARPRLQLARANDMIELGQKNRGAAEIYTMVKTYPQHPDFGKWVQRLREVLAPAPADPTPEPTNIAKFHSMTSTGQLLLVGVPGAELDAESAAFFKKLQPGGFILFGRNIQTPSQLRKLIDDLRDLSDVEPIITIDQEGGRVSRLKLIGNEPPNAQQLRDRDDIGLIRKHGDITGRLLRLFGFNLDLCPVLDISFDDEADNSLKGRCYGRTVAEVIEKAGAFNAGLRSTGVLSCGKHFPGYSSAGLDPHHELPRLDRSRELMEEYELAVFRHFADTVDSMMIGHISISGLECGARDTETRRRGDAENFPASPRPPVSPSSLLPASLDPAIIDGLLRRDMGFDGLVMTDDLDMGAILNHYGFDETMRMGLAAGNDMLMICHRVELAAQAKVVVDALPPDAVDPALARMATFKRGLVPPDAFSEEAFRAVDSEVWDLRVATLGAELAAQRSAEDGKRSPVELY